MIKIKKEFDIRNISKKGVSRFLPLFLIIGFLFCLSFVPGIFGESGSESSGGYFCMPEDEDCYIPLPTFTRDEWVHVNGLVVTTPFVKLERTSQYTWEGDIYNREFVKEDNQVKRYTEAESLKGKGFSIKRLEDDGVHDFEYVDWNATSVSFRVEIKDTKEIGKDFFVKQNGIVKETVKLSSLDSKSDVITFHFENGTVGGNSINWSAGSSSTIDTISKDNGTFEDGRIYGSTGGTNWIENFGDYEDQVVNRADTYTTINNLRLNLAEVISEGVLGVYSIDNLTVSLYSYAISGTPYVTATETTCLWEEGDLYCELGNQSWNSPNSSYQSSAGDALWTTGVGTGAGAIKPECLGVALSLKSGLPVVNTWIDIDLTQAGEGGVQRMYDDIGNISYSLNITEAVSGYDQMAFRGTQHATHSPIYRIIFSIANTAPTIKDNEVTLTPEGTAGPDFDLSCTFTPVDPDNETLTAYVIWSNHSVEAPEHSSSKQVNNDTDPESFILDDAYTTIGDKWKCSVKVCDHADCSGWTTNSSETDIISVANKTDFTTGIGNIQSNKVKDVYVYEASKETWNRTASDVEDSWYSASRTSFPEKVYLLLTDTGLDIVDASDTDQSWMDFVGGSGNAINGNDFTSVYALDGKVYVGSDLGLYVLDFANDNITRYDNTNGFATFDHQTPFHDDFRNNGLENYFTLDATKALASNIVNDVYANRVRGEYLVGVATEGTSTGAVNIVNLNDLDDVDDDTVAELDFVTYNAANEKYSSDSIFIANDGTLYYSENRLQSNKGNTKLSFKYDIDAYTGTAEVADDYYLSRGSGGRATTYPHFLSEFINDVYVASGKSRAHLLHNMLYVATENGVSVIQEIQSHEGSGTSKNYGYTSSANSNIDYKVLDGSTDNFTSVVARSDGNEMYVGNNDGVGGGWVSKISLSSNTLVDYWNSTSDTSIIGEDITSLDFLDGDLLVGTLSSGATQIVEEELDHYLITDYTNHRVVEIDNTGLIYWDFGVYGVASNETNYLTHPTYAVRHDDGNYLIADSGNRRILEISPDKEVIQVITNATQLSDATSFGEVYSIQKIS